MDKAGQARDLTPVFQSKPGKFHARFNYFEQLYVTLISCRRYACRVAFPLFNFLLQISRETAHFSLHVNVTAAFACVATVVKIEPRQERKRRHRTLA
ncbi:hypothetical protein ACWXWB_06110 [Pantoea dispersa]|uniref:hypothetical protein n=1 Tax=Pantoea dispersa TaxID=59814 RepID=UPI002DB69C35|nr:hypothetical protein [Pantoea dispersa]MEB5972283.1 hypothetical protein [Pantoea dispersa]